MEANEEAFCLATQAGGAAGASAPSPASPGLELPSEALSRGREAAG